MFIARIIGGRDNAADIFTKPLGRVKFLNLGNVRTASSLGGRPCWVGVVFHVCMFAPLCLFSCSPFESVPSGRVNVGELSLS